MKAAEEVAQTIVERLKEGGLPQAVRVERSEIMRITGFLPSILVEEIRKELAMESLLFAEVPTDGFVVVNPTGLTEVPTLTLIRRRRPV